MTVALLAAFIASPATAQVGAPVPAVPATGAPVRPAAAPSPARPVAPVSPRAATVAAPARAAAAPAPRPVTYQNPVLPGFHPDPSVVRAGGWFYLVNSSFEFFPGVPIYRSADLVNWTSLGYVLSRPSQLPLATAGPSGGIYAPTIRYNAGTFYMITTNVSARGNFLVTARNPAGPWSEPIWIEGQGGIDPSLFFDDDGKAYLTSTGGAPGAPSESGIWQSLIDVRTGKVQGAPRLIWKGTGGRYPEGPHLYRVFGRYYLMISEGGTEYGHMVTIARSSSPWGPFEPCSRNPILTHRNTQMDQPIQGTGHADLVQDVQGHWWMVFLGFRPVGGGYWQHLGRETLLAPVRWDPAGWPVVNEGKPITPTMTVPDAPPQRPLRAPVARDDFNGPLGPAWNWLRNPVAEDSSTTTRKGWLTLRGSALTMGAVGSPTFVGRRQEHFAVRMATRLDFVPGATGDEAGMVLYRTPTARYELGVRRAAGNNGQREVFVRQTVGRDLSVITAIAPVPGMEPILLQIDATTTAYDLSWGTSPGAMNRLAVVEPRLLATEVTGGFIGTFVGLYATGNGLPASVPAAFDWFDYQPAAAPAPALASGH